MIYSMEAEPMRQSKFRVSSAMAAAIVIVNKVDNIVVGSKRFSRATDNIHIRAMLME